MSRPRIPWRLAGALLGLVLVSALGGFLLGHRFTRREIESRNDPDTWNRHVAEEFDRRVHPTPDQAPRVQAHLDQAVRDLRELRRETIARSTNIIGRLVTQVEKELTPDQRQAFEAMKPRPEDLTLDLLNVDPTPPQSKGSHGTL